VKSSRGRFIVIEGLDGAGTTTQCAELAKALRAAGRDVHVTNEPTGGPIGTLIRQALSGRLGLPNGAGALTPQTLALLFAADRVDHLAAEIEPALARGATVLCDRYVLSSLAYQGSQVGMPWVEAINSQADRPDLTLFLNIELGVAAQRRTARGLAPELYETDEAQTRTAKQYRHAMLLREKAGERIVELDGGLAMHEVTRRALKAIEALKPRSRR
jgi:dTMP kinase